MIFFKAKNVCCEYGRLSGWNSTLEAAWYVRQLWKLHDTSDNFGRCMIRQTRSSGALVMDIWCFLSEYGKANVLSYSIPVPRTKDRGTVSPIYLVDNWHLDMIFSQRKTSAVSVADWVVTQLWKLHNTSDTLIGRACYGYLVSLCTYPK